MTLLDVRLKTRYGLIVGERTLEELNEEVSRFGRATIRVSGRALSTGRKKVIHVTLGELLE